MMVIGIFKISLYCVALVTMCSSSLQSLLKDESDSKLTNVADTGGNHYTSTGYLSPSLETNMLFMTNAMDVTSNVKHLRVQSSTFVELHDKVRASVSPKATPALPAVSVSATLEAYATKHAQDCIFEHGGPDYTTNYYGQNIYASAGFTPTNDEIVNSWAVEANDYNYNTNSCQSGKICGHYTQLVWRSSTSIGCYVNKCSGNSPFGSTMPEWYFAVCNYLAPGNYADQKPY